MSQRSMTAAEWNAFAAEGTRTGKLATVRADGRPHLAPVWFVLDGDALIFTTGAETAKGRNLRRDGRVMFGVDLEEPPYAYVLIEGTAALSDDLDEMLVWATRIGARYMGEAAAEAFGRRNAVPGELLVRVTPTKVLSDRDVTA